jgi:hypothetical protein
MSLDAAAVAAETFAEEMRQRMPFGPAHRGLDPADPGAVHPVGRKLPDNLGGPGAHRLAGVIRSYWRDRGFEISLTVSSTDGFSTIYSIRSNLVDGKPREICHPSTSCARRGQVISARQSIRRRGLLPSQPSIDTGRGAEDWKVKLATFSIT